MTFRRRLPPQPTRRPRAARRRSPRRTSASLRWRRKLSRWRSQLILIRECRGFVRSFAGSRRLRCQDVQRFRRHKCPRKVRHLRRRRPVRNGRWRRSGKIRAGLPPKRRTPRARIPALAWSLAPGRPGTPRGRPLRGRPPRRRLSCNAQSPNRRLCRLHACAGVSCCWRALRRRLRWREFHGFPARRQQRRRRPRQPPAPAQVPQLR
jgi:hypothetical protein